ncbi:MAG TPA: hypothetical protein VF352_02515 [Anaerolineales bacterium]
MLRKIFVFLVVTSIFASLLSACGGSSADSNAKKLLTGLTDKAKTLVNQPGWVHVTEKIVYDTDKQDRGTLSNGTMVPLVQTVDIWYNINAEKLVYQYVWTMSSQDGQTVETIVFLNKLLYNLTTNVSNPLNPYTLSLDYQFADEMDYFISSSGHHPVVTTVELDGKTATVFTLNEQLASPRTTEDYTQTINAIGSIAYFDAESGFLLRLERTVVLADGSKRTFYTDKLTIDIGVQPPRDIQDYINGIW